VLLDWAVRQAWTNSTTKKRPPKAFTPAGGLLRQEEVSMICGNSFYIFTVFIIEPPDERGLYFL
jgi:hypothetical protein